ncbi:39S ribosomal protein S30, mitochondrial [Plectropomus leopardus]|uniref:39S ribosomal protein S30, mitochondrial n=1 Tax=Plectropomus leopardus TaxID=160734 RepID=UPI001C4D8FE2|nr:39S ribosomal protein S30, mitochondrial [Plectropomus leopardus]XP_042344118.1 39S ribosomal protein S30, mitochondrial [Plectropomus leopardus]XP_042344119.1 39S ribosomal protein S30, mitochondrial [Plectropomus leopardus]
MAAVRTRLPLLFPKNLPPLRNQKFAHTEAEVKVPAYPPIVPSLTAKSKSARARQAQEQVRKIRGSPLQEKISLITRIQRKKFVVYPQTFARNADRWYQHLTKTAYIPGLPEKFTPAPERIPGGEEAEESSPAAAAQTSVPGVDDEGFSEIRSLVTRVILMEHWHLKKRRPYVYRQQEQTVGPFLRSLVTELSHSLVKYNPLLRLSSLDIDPQVNFYWRRGQRNIPKGHRRGHQEPIRFQIDDHPHSQIRITQQLPQFAPLEASYAAEVPVITQCPNLMPLFRRQYDNHIFTGAKLPDPACYGHTQFHMVPDRYHRDRMAQRQQSDQVEVFLRANGLASLFAWTGAQAMYQGFWNHEDVTRPFVSQAVITDGHFFSFFCYQLNTVALSVETDANNPRKNLLWGTESLRLYESVQDGEVVGLNDGVIRLLVQFLMNQP